MTLPNCIEGNQHSDERGKMHFFNTFDMNDVVRFYEIVPANTQFIRAWQGHQHERKWFYCNAGSFIVHLIELDNFHIATTSYQSQSFILEEEIPLILEIPSGFANGFRALEKDSKLMVFSDFTLEQSKNDDYRFELDAFEVDWR